MLLITVHTGQSWAWVLKSVNQDRAICVGFGYPTRSAAEAHGREFAELIKED